jgi:putative membrane protein insertion efficiency factor
MALLKTILSMIDRALAYPLIMCVYIYKYTLTSVFGGRCRFYPTCSSYALDALKTKSAALAILLIIKRLSKCHPLHSGGFDPVK